MKLSMKLNIGEQIDTPNKDLKLYPLYYDGVHSRRYRLAEELKDSLLITDSGRVNTVYIRNNSKYPIFIRAGTILKGNTQNRTLKRSMLVFPNQEAKDFENVSYVKAAEVFCVHATHGINASSGTFGVDCLLPHNLESLCYTSSNQGQMWNNINTCFTNDVPLYKAASDDLTTKLKVMEEQYGNTVDQIISKHPQLGDAVGVAIIDSNNILAIELYDSTESWNVMMKKILTKYSKDFSLKNAGTYTTGNYWKDAKNKIQTMLSSSVEVLNKFSDTLDAGKDKWIAVTYQGNVREKYEAELTTLNKKVIHMAIVRGSRYRDESIDDNGPITVLY